MGFIIGLLTLFMVLDCVVLVFLVLIQLPKKEAGAGLAFGASASDALFGAGSGNVLTKITKYAATIFFVMAVLLSILQSKFHSRSVSGFQERLEQARTPALPPAPANTPTTPPITQSNNVPQTNQLMSQPDMTNAPAATAPPNTPAPNTPAAEPK